MILNPTRRIVPSTKHQRYMKSRLSCAMSWRSRRRSPPVVDQETASLKSSASSRVSPQNRGRRAQGSGTTESETRRSASTRKSATAPSPAWRATASRLSVPLSCASNPLFRCGSASRELCWIERSARTRHMWTPSVPPGPQKRVPSRRTRRNIIPAPSAGSCIRWHSLHWPIVRQNERAMAEPVCHVLTNSEPDSGLNATSFTLYGFRPKRVALFEWGARIKRAHISAEWRFREELLVHCCPAAQSTQKHLSRSNDGVRPAGCARRARDSRWHQPLRIHWRFVQFIDGPLSIFWVNCPWPPPSPTLKQFLLLVILTYVA